MWYTLCICIHYIHTYSDHMLWSQIYEDIWVLRTMVIFQWPPLSIPSHWSSYFVFDQQIKWKPGSKFVSLSVCLLISSRSMGGASFDIGDYVIRWRRHQTIRARNLSMHTNHTGTTRRFILSHPLRPTNSFVYRDGGGFFWPPLTVTTIFNGSIGAI